MNEGPVKWTLPQALPLGQGVFYLTSGIWPLVDMASFEVVTGRKTDKWLVKTVGLLVAVSGGALIYASKKKQPSPEIKLIAIGSAASLAVIDFIYVAKRRISPVYLLDGIAEVAFVLSWVSKLRARR